MTDIEEKAFENCVSLESITLPTGLTHIAYFAFSGCIGLNDIYIPQTVKILSHMAFFKCPYLTVHCYKSNLVSTFTEQFTGKEVIIHETTV